MNLFLAKLFLKDTALTFSCLGFTVFSFGSAWAQPHGADSGFYESAPTNDVPPPAPQNRLVMKDYPNGILAQVPGSHCDTLKVFFPGHAQELGLKGVVPASRENAWPKYLLTKKAPYYLGDAILKSECPTFILRDSSTQISQQSLAKILAETGVGKIEAISHSGGFVGLGKSLGLWSEETKAKVTKIAMLDNFYGKSSSMEKLTQNFSPAKLKELCIGFTTPHNRSNYTSYFQKYCPNVQKGGPSEHKSRVAAYF